jgi:hypothetical protein
MFKGTEVLDLCSTQHCVQTFFNTRRYVILTNVRIEFINLGVRLMQLQIIRCKSSQQDRYFCKRTGIQIVLFGKIRHEKRI